MRTNARLGAISVLALLLTGCASSVPAGPAASVPAAGQLVGAGVDVRFYPDGAVRLCGHDVDPGYSMGLSSCDDGLAVSGVTTAELHEQLAEVPYRYTEEGVEIVPALVVGTLSGRTLELVSTDQERYVLESAATPTPQPTTPPSFDAAEEKDAYIRSEPVPQPEGCAAPTGGWTSMAAIGLTDAEHYHEAHPDQVLGTAQTYVDHDNTIIAIVAAAADADAAAIAADLAPSYPDSLCVVSSPFTAADLQRVQTDPILNESDTVLDAGLWIARQGWDDPEPRFTSTVTVLSPELLDAADSYPDGLVSIVPWFEPVVDRGA